MVKLESLQATPQPRANRPGLLPFAGGAMSIAHDVTAAERIEAEVRIAMAAVTKARGYDSQRVRDDDIAFVDSLLDAYNDLARG